jgi:hypothetical protein
MLISSDAFGWNLAANSMQALISRGVALDFLIDGGVSTWSGSYAGSSSEYTRLRLRVLVSSLSAPW